LGGIVAGASGPHLAYWLNAGTFVVSALLLLPIPGRLLQSAPAPSRGYWHDVADGFSVVRRSRALLAVFCAWNLVMVSNAFVNVAEVALAKVSFNAGSFGFGLMWTASGVGSALGSLLAASSLEKRGLATVYASAIGLMAFGAGAAAASP